MAYVKDRPGNGPFPLPGPKVKKFRASPSPIDHTPLLAGDEVMVSVFFTLVPLLSEVERPLGILRGFLRQGSQNLLAATVFLFEEATNGIVSFHYFHTKKIAV
jgi:hypothetical protein